MENSVNTGNSWAALLNCFTLTLGQIFQLLFDFALIYIEVQDLGKGNLPPSKAGSISLATVIWNQHASWGALLLEVMVECAHWGMEQSLITIYPVLTYGSMCHIQVEVHLKFRITFYGGGRLRPNLEYICWGSLVSHEWGVPASWVKAAEWIQNQANTLVDECLSDE